MTSAQNARQTLYFADLNLVQRLGVVVTFLAFGVLVPGVTEPMMTLAAKINFLGFEHDLFKETRSILGTVEHLADAGYAVVGGLVLTFSVIIPVLKALLVILALFTGRPLIWKTVAILGKWSMADVFVVAVMVAFFSTKAAVELNAELHSGFYWFLTYCLLSVFSGQLLVWNKSLMAAPAPALEAVEEKSIKPE